MPETLILHFMRTRKRGGKQHAQAIIDFLQNRFSDNDGWVQAKDIHKSLVKGKKIPEGPILFNLLRDLTRYRVIERRENIVPSSRSRPNKQKPSVFYRLSHLASIDCCLMPDIIDKVKKSMKVRMHEQQFDFMVARKILENHGLLEEFERMKDADEFANYRKFIEDYRSYA
jgi:hypothetical protein